MIIKSYKKTAAALALYAGVSAALLFMGACSSGSSTKITLNSAEDSLAYCMGSMQKLQYMHFIETSCMVDSNYRTVCFEGIEKGYKDTERNTSYYNGKSLGVQIMGYFIEKDVKLASKSFVYGMVDGAFDREKNEEYSKDSVYHLGVNNSNILRECLKETEYSVNEKEQFILGFEDGGMSLSNPEKYALACGELFGNIYLRKALDGVNMQIYGKDTTKTLSPELFYAGFIDSNSKDALILHKDVNRISIKLDYELKDKLYSDNREEGEKFLEQNAKKPGVQTLPSGIQYKILKKGNGKKPSIDNGVLVHYVGKTLDGEVFSDTRRDYGQPYSMTIKEANKCYKEVLLLMSEGSACEIYVPYRDAFGTLHTEYFKPFSAVIYELELIKITE